MTGPYAVDYWFLIVCNIVAPQVLWFKKVRSNAGAAVRLVASWCWSACGWSAS